jgi:TM2 domain-containing membrane protein YozV
MIPLPFWLTNIQFVIGAFGAFAFFSAAWLNVDSWAVRREVRTGFRSLGFIFLAIWSGLHGIGLMGVVMEIVTAAVLLSGILLLLLSFIFDKLPLQPKDLAKLRRQQDNIVSKKEEPKDKKIVPTEKKILSPIKPPRPVPASKARAIVKTAATKRALPKINAGLSSTAFLKLPKKKRGWITSFLNAVVGFIIFALIGWGSYATYEKWFGAKEEQDIQFEESNFIEMNDSLPASEAEPTEEDSEEPVVEASPEIKKDTVTVKETETGYLNVRGGAGIIHDIIITISPGDTFELLDEDRDWYEIQVDENTAGWVSNRYITKNE